MNLMRTQRYASGLDLTFAHRRGEWMTEVQHCLAGKNAMELRPSCLRHRVARYYTSVQCVLHGVESMNETGSQQWNERPSVRSSWPGEAGVALPENEGLFRLLFESSSDTILLQDPQTHQI